MIKKKKGLIVCCCDIEINDHSAELSTHIDSDELEYWRCWRCLHFVLVVSTTSNAERTGVNVRPVFSRQNRGWHSTQGPCGWEGKIRSSNALI